MLPDDTPSLDRAFWLIVLTSWPIEYVAILEEYAQNCERSVTWNHDLGRPQFGL